MTEDRYNTILDNQFDTEQLEELNLLREEWNSFHWNDSRNRKLFLSNNENTIKLVAINFYRGVERLHRQDLPPSMFNMSTWWNQGIVESHTLRTHSSDTVAAAINHGRQTVWFINAITVNNETFGMFNDQVEFIAWDDIALFNDDDFNAYLR